MNGRSARGLAMATEERTIPEIICTEEYVGPDRRAYRKTLEQVEAHFDLKLHDHEDREMAQIRGLLDTMMSGVMQAFPDGVEAHRSAHQAMIDAKKAEEAFWTTAKDVALKNGIAGIFAVARWVLILAIVGLAFKLGFGPAVAKLLGVPL